MAVEIDITAEVIICCIIAIVLVSFFFGMYAGRTESYNKMIANCKGIERFEIPGHAGKYFCYKTDER